MNDAIGKRRNKKVGGDNKKYYIVY